MKKKTSPAQTASPVQTQALDTSAAEREARNSQLGQVNQTVNDAKPGLQRLTSFDANGQNPLRTALTNAKTFGTNLSYNNAITAFRARGLANGLAGQPMQSGNEAALENQRASALGHIPSEVEQEATPLELQATGLQNSLAQTQLGVAGQYSPESYFSTGAGLEGQRQNALNDQYLDEQRRKGALWKGLANTAVGIGSAGAVRNPFS